MDMSARVVESDDKRISLHRFAMESLNAEVQQIVGLPVSLGGWTRLQAIADGYIRQAVEGHVKFDDITADLMRIGTYSLNILLTHDNYVFWEGVKAAYQFAATHGQSVVPTNDVDQVGFNALEANPPDMYAFNAITCILMSMGDGLDHLCSAILELENVPRKVRVAALARHVDRSCFLRWSIFWFEESMQGTPGFWRDLLIASRWTLPLNQIHEIYERLMSSKYVYNGRILLVFLQYARDNITGCEGCCNTEDLNEMMHNIITGRTCADEDPDEPDFLYCNRSRIRIVLCILALNRETGYEIYRKYMNQIITFTGRHVEAFIEVLLKRFAEDDSDPMNDALFAKLTDGKADGVDDRVPSDSRIYDILFKYGAKLDERVPIWEVARTGSIGFLGQALKKKADAIMSDDTLEDKYKMILNAYEEGVLENACTSGNPKMVQFLLDSGAEIKIHISLVDAMRSQNDDLMQRIVRDVTLDDFEYAFDAEDPIGNEDVTKQSTREANNRLLRVKLLRYLRGKGGQYEHDGDDMDADRDGLLREAGFKLVYT